MEGRKKKEMDHSIYCKLRFDVKHLSEQTDSEDVNTMGQIRFVFTFWTLFASLTFSVCFEDMILLCSTPRRSAQTGTDGPSSLLSLLSHSLYLV